MALLRKPDAIKVPVPVKYVGFDIPNEFVVGYGLDYAERYRDLPYIGRLQAVGLQLSPLDLRGSVGPARPIRARRPAGRAEHPGTPRVSHISWRSGTRCRAS